MRGYDMLPMALVVDTKVVDLSVVVVHKLFAAENILSIQFLLLEPLFLL